MNRGKRLTPLIVLILILGSLALPYVYADPTLFETSSDSSSVSQMKDLHPSDSAEASAVCQSFQSPGRYNLTSARFSLERYGVTPTGTAYAKLYAHSGTYGTNSVPTGAALATSAGFDVSTLLATTAWIWFNFTDADVYELQPDEYYVIAYENPTAGTITTSFYVEARWEVTSPAHSGNAAEYRNGAWVTYDRDTKFELWGDFINNDPTLVNASIPDMDDTDNCYAMTYYNFTAVVADADGATDIEKVYLRILQESAIRGEVRGTALNTGTPTWAVYSNATIIELNSTACSFTESGVNGTAVFSVAFEWDYTQEEDLEIAVYVEDASSVSAGWTTLQSNYTDVISRLVTYNFGANVSSTSINQPIELTGYVRYATTATGNLASSTSPPDGQFTSVQIQDDQEATVGTDATIVDGFFNAVFNASSIPRTTLYYAYLDLLDDYVDGLAPDGDVVYVTTIPAFYLADIIDQAFSFFGILDYVVNATAYGTALGAYFIDSITNIVQLITQQFLLVLGIFDFFIDWYTRMMSLVTNIGSIVTGLFDGTGAIVWGAGSFWDYISFSTWIDIVPVALVLWWIDSITKRGTTQGEVTVFLGDMQTVMNVTSWFLSMFGLIINTVTDLAFRLLGVIT